MGEESRTGSKCNRNETIWTIKEIRKIGIMQNNFVFPVTFVLFCGIILPQIVKQFTPAAAKPPQYEIYAVRYASIPDFPVSALIKGADPSRKIEIAMMVWLIKGNGHVVLFDSGFYREKFFKQWKVNDFTKPSEAIAQSGINPEDVTDLVISHMHWDHADGMDLFPKAKIWIQKDEFKYYTGEAWQQPRTHGGIEQEDVLALVRANMEGRVAFLNGDDQEIMPGIRSYIGGKHTFQSQFISVNTRSGNVVLASDNMYLYENMEKHLPITQTLDEASNLKSQDRMKQIASDPKFIIPGHDPAVLERFTKVADRVVRID
jgi:glyoxylase-like metal-dependent hydrolase (beta-lactamase superfamily II)